MMITFSPFSPQKVINFPILTLIPFLFPDAAGQEHPQERRDQEDEAREIRPKNVFSEWPSQSQDSSHELADRLFVEDVERLWRIFQW